MGSYASELVAVRECARGLGLLGAATRMLRQKLTETFGSDAIRLDNQVDAVFGVGVSPASAQMRS